MFPQLSPQTWQNISVWSSGRGGTASSAASSLCQAAEAMNPGLVTERLRERRSESRAALSFPRPGTRGRHRNIEATPSTAQRLWDRTDDLAGSTTAVHSEATAQLDHYRIAYEALMSSEDRRRRLSEERSRAVAVAADAALRRAEALGRVHGKEIYLSTLRQAAREKAASEEGAMVAMAANEPWVMSKQSKLELEREVARAERQLLAWRRSADAEFASLRTQMDKVALEERRLDTQLSKVGERLESVQADVSAEQAALEALEEEPDCDSGPFGWFVDEEDGGILPGIERLRVDVQQLDALAPVSKLHALQRLERRYQQLRGLALELRAVSATSQRFRLDADLNHVIPSVQQQAAEALEASSARLLLLDGGGGRLWSMEGPAGEEERVVVPLGPGVTGRCVKTREALVAEACAEDPRFEAAVDSPAANLLVNNMMAFPIMHPFKVTQLLGVLQVHNKKGGTQVFSPRDVMIGHQLAEQVAIAVQSGLELSSWSGRRDTMHRIRGVGSALVQELGVGPLVAAVQRAACGLFQATSAAVYTSDSCSTPPAIRPGFDASAAALEGGASLELLELVAVDGLKVVVPDAAADDRFDSAAEDAAAGSRGLRTRSLMAAPLRDTAGRVIGVVEVRRGWARGRAQPPDGFSTEDVEALGMLCALASIALSNARLAESCSRGNAAPRTRGEGLWEAAPGILRGLQARVPCRLARLFLRVEDASEVWAADSASPPEASPARLPLDGTVRAAIKARRVSAIQVGATPRRDGPRDIVRVHGASLGRAGLAIGPLPADTENAPGVCDSGFAGLDGGGVRHILTAPAMREGCPTATAAVQLVDRPDGLPFTQQDECLLRCAAADAAVMVEAAQLVSGTAQVTAQLQALADALEEMPGVGALPGERGFDAWLEGHVRRAVPCDSFTAYWHSGGSGQLATAEGQQLATDGATLPPPPTPAQASASPLPTDAVRHVFNAVISRRTTAANGSTSHLCAVVPSSLQPAGEPLGVLYLLGGPMRAQAIGGSAFTPSDRRFIDDLAAHIGILIDMQSAPPSISGRSASLSLSLAGL